MLDTDMILKHFAQFSFKLNISNCNFPSNLLLVTNNMMSMFMKRKKQDSKNLKKQDDCDSESFVFKTHSISETTKKIIEIHDFAMKIEDQNQDKIIVSPKIKLAGKEFSIGVVPNVNNEYVRLGCFRRGVPYIGVYLLNYSNEKQMFSMTVDWTIDCRSGMIWRLEKSMVPVGKILVASLSYEKYRKWSKKNGDVLKLEVILTVHTTEGDGWTW